MNEAIVAELEKDIWMMEPKSLDSLAHQAAAAKPVGAQSIIELTGKDKSFTKAERRDGVAIVPIKGVLVKSVPWWYDLLEVKATAYPQITYQIEDAVSDPDVKQIHLHIESPGGHVAGGMEVGDAIYAARKTKPVHAFVEDMAASGAYWLASQAQTITANANAVVGSIGVFVVYVDYSQMAENVGAKVHVIRSGEHKGAHVAGAKITEEQIAAIQEMIDDTANNFVKAVARGRDLKTADVQKLATGQVWIAAKAKSRGLIDNVGSAIKISRKDSKNMSTEKNEANVDVEAIEKQASASAVKSERERFTALQNAFPDESSFVSEQFVKGATVEQAKVAYNDVLQAKLADSEKVNADLQSKLESGSDTSDDDAGNKAVEQKGTPSGSVDSDFMSAAREYANEHNMSVGKAIKAVRRANPELHQAWVNSKE